MYVVCPLWGTQILWPEERFRRFFIHHTWGIAKVGQSDGQRVSRLFQPDGHIMENKYQRAIFNIYFYYAVLA